MIAGLGMAITLSRDDICAVADEVVCRLMPILGVERHEQDPGHVSAERRAEIAVEADKTITMLLQKRAKRNAEKQSKGK